MTFAFVLPASPRSRRPMRFAALSLPGSATARWKVGLTSLRRKDLNLSNAMPTALVSSGRVGDGSDYFASRRRCTPAARPVARWRAARRREALPYTTLLKRGPARENSGYEGVILLACTSSRGPRAAAVPDAAGAVRPG